MENTNSVISWFKQLRDKNRLSFVNFDVESFYPSITENLFQEAINFARNIVDISNTELSIVMQARKTLLFMMIHHGLNVQEMRNLMYQWVHTMAQRSAN